MPNKTLHKIYAGLFALLTVGAFGYSFAQASGFSFSAGKQVNWASGSTVIHKAPSGTVQGFSTHPSGTCGANEVYYRQLLGAGATWQRTDLAWSSIQATSSASYVWTTADCFVNDAITAGISTVLIIDSTPTWAKYASCGSGAGTCAPVNSTTLGTFCTQAATHFNGRISYWEIWNEENANGNWGPAATSSDYVLALNACGTAIKAVNPSATIIVGGLNSSSGVWSGINWQTYTDAVITGGGTFDMFAVHPYTYSLTVNDTVWGWSGSGNGVVYGTRRSLNSNGMSAKKIIITEYGAPTCGPNAVSLANQANEASTMIATTTGASASFMNLYSIIFWYTLVDANSNDPSTSENCFGVYYTNGNAKPAYSQLRSN